jgi:hypothetical protein
VRFEIFNSQKATWEIKGAKIKCILRFSIAKTRKKIKRRIWLQYISSIFLIKIVAKFHNLAIYFFSKQEKKNTQKSVGFYDFFWPFSK